MKSLNAVDIQTAAGRITNTRSSASARPETATAESWLREHEEAEHDEQGDLSEEREALVEIDQLASKSRRRAADGQADEVHREEAAAPDHVRDTERQRSRGERRNRGERPDRVRQTSEDPRRQQTQGDSDRESEAELPDDEQGEIGKAVAARALDPRNQSERECDRHRVVAARFGLQRARKATPYVRETKRREHRCGICRCNDSAEEDSLEPREVEQQERGHTG